MSVKLEVWGDGALFSRPEFKVEKVSYDVMTPSAARGVLEAIYWHPGLCWVIDRIVVMNPIRFNNIKRNEVKSTISPIGVRTALRKNRMVTPLYTAEDKQPRAAMYLRDVRYVIEAHFVLTDAIGPDDSAAKFQSMFNRRAAKGQCYHHPYLGCREFPAAFRLRESDEEPRGFEMGNRDLGFMLYDMDYSDPENIKPMFFRGVLHNGVLDCENIEVMS